MMLPLSAYTSVAWRHGSSGSPIEVDGEQFFPLGELELDET